MIVIESGLDKVNAPAANRHSTPRSRAKETRPLTEANSTTLTLFSNGGTGVFGSHNSITTQDKPRTVGQIEPGDLVLTQTGDFRLVVAKNRYRATEKPCIVEIEAEWRKDRTHKLSLSTEHRVLAYREGRNKWIAAGDLRDDDCLYHRKKVALNKDTGPLKVCSWCGRGYRTQGHTYCSVKCRNECWATEGNPNLGSRRTPEQRKTMSEARKALYAANPELHPNRIVAGRGKMTGPERTIAKWLNSRGVRYEAQKYVAGFWVDFYLPDHDMILEADGAFWHQDQNRDIRRDVVIRAALPEVTIVHIHLFEERFSPKLDLKPVPGVYYVPCNPGPGSYCDPTMFEPTPIVGIRPWRYRCEKLFRTDSRAARLYDLAVDGAKSYLANGIIVEAVA